MLLSEICKTKLVFSFQQHFIAALNSQIRHDIPQRAVGSSPGRKFIQKINFLMILKF